MEIIEFQGNKENFKSSHEAINRQKGEQYPQLIDKADPGLEPSCLDFPFRDLFTRVAQTQHTCSCSPFKCPWQTSTIHGSHQTSPYSSMTDLAHLSLSGRQHKKSGEGESRLQSQIVREQMLGHFIHCWELIQNYSIFLRLTFLVYTMGIIVSPTLLLWVED